MLHAYLHAQPDEDVIGWGVHIIEGLNNKVSRGCFLYSVSELRGFGELERRRFFRICERSIFTHLRGVVDAFILLPVEGRVDECRCNH